MRQHLRIRRVAKWTGMGVCAISLIGCPISYAGRLNLFADRYPPGAFVKVYLVAGDLRLKILKCRPVDGAPRGDYGADLPSMPLWALLFVSVLVTAWLFRHDRPAIQPGHCSCGYDLTGNVTGVYPECGVA